MDCWTGAILLQFIYQYYLILSVLCMRNVWHFSGREERDMGSKLHAASSLCETTRTQALASVRGMLSPEGMVGVVQHRLPESAPAEGSDGSRGYLKQSEVIAMFEEAGFELVDSSEINANPKDKPGAEDVVWRLPPSLRGSKDDPEKRAAMEAIGESDRMTLLFQKAQ